MKSIGILVLTTLLLHSSRAQDSRCNCLQNLDTLIARTERNYAGYPGKVNTRTRPAYEQLKNALQVKAGQVREPRPCFSLLRDYVRFFSDSHFNLRYYDEADLDTLRVSLTETAFKEELQQRKPHALEGIWVNPDSSLTLAIRRAPGETFQAIVLSSKNPQYKPGLVYMTIRQGKRGLIAQYFNTFSSTHYPIKQKGNLLMGWTDDLFGRIYPQSMTTSEQEELSSWRNGNGGLRVYALSPKTLVLRVPSFGNNDAQIAELVQQHDALIRSTDNLIVDLTGNGGGSTGWVSFLPYFQTGPIVQQNGFVRVSPENVQLKLTDLEPFVNNPIPPEYTKYFPDSVLATYKRAYRELPTTQAAFYPVPGVNFPLDSVTVRPKKIALLVDELCGSSTEYFFFLSKASGKLTSYGVNTFGMMDYEGAGSTALPYDKFRVSIPIVKSSWTDQQPIDNTGFRPDVLLDKIRPEDWIRHVQRLMEQSVR
jgi:hypothetical protein